MEGMGSPGARIVLSPDEGEKVMMGGLGVRFMIEGAESGGTFALGAIMAKYRLDMDMDSIPTLVERHGLVTDEPPA
jgi:hypothetical protein